MKQSFLRLLVAALLLVLVSGGEGDHRRVKNSISGECQLPSADAVECNTLIVDCYDQMDEASVFELQSITCLDLNWISERKLYLIIESNCDVLDVCRCTVAHRLHCNYTEIGSEEGDEFSPPPADFCFSGDTLVETDKGIMDLREVRDLSSDSAVSVKTIDAEGNVRFAPVIGWLHASDDDPHEKYNRVVVADGRYVQVSDMHVLYTVPCTGGARQQKFAAELSIGQCLLVERDGQMTPSPIVELSKVDGDGIYSPVTATGTVLVNGIGASCYPTKQERASHFLSRGMFLLGTLPLGQVVPGHALYACQREML